MAAQPHGMRKVGGSTPPRSTVSNFDHYQPKKGALNSYGRKKAI